MVARRPRRPRPDPAGGGPARRRRLRRRGDRGRAPQHPRQVRARPGRPRLGHPAWNTAVEAALEQAAERGITIDLTIGPAWPAAVPTITPGSAAAAKELAHGSVTVPAGTTYSGPIPPPAIAPAAHPAISPTARAAIAAAARPTEAPATVADRELLLVQAARIDPAHSTRDETGLDPASSGPSASPTTRRSPGPPPPTATGCSSPPGSAGPASAPSPARTPPPRRTSWTTSAAPAPRR
ncbi:hypothetical protein ACFQ0B_68750 [Nonomuraea thailandensis]